MSQPAPTTKRPIAKPGDLTGENVTGPLSATRRNPTVAKVVPEATKKLIPTRDRIVRDVIRGLYEGRYYPGQRLTEPQLTLEYGTSRGPVREALNCLATLGTVELRLQRGAQVRVLELSEAADILVVAQALIGAAARQAAQRINRRGSVEKLQAALARLGTFHSSAVNADYATARDSFYASLVHIADNAELKRILPGIQIHLIRVQFHEILRAADERRHDNYQRICQAVLDGSEARAEAAVAAHFGLSIKALRSRV